MINNWHLFFNMQLTFNIILTSKEKKTIYDVWLGSGDNSQDSWTMFGRPTSRRLRRAAVESVLCPAITCTGCWKLLWLKEAACPPPQTYTQPDAEKGPPAGPHPPCTHTLCPPPLRPEMEEHQEQKQQFQNQLLSTKQLTPNLSMTCHFNVL